LSVSVRRARQLDVYALWHLDREPDQPCYVAEVENWALHDAWSWFADPANDMATLLVAEAPSIIGIAGFTRISPGIWYIPGVLVEATSRGQGVGKAMLDAAITEIGLVDSTPRIEWLAHHQNHAMAGLSLAVGANHIESIALLCNGGPEDLYAWWRLT
jgi:RimJ/RimL family protein N-acetyltransferase